MTQDENGQNNDAPSQPNQDGAKDPTDALTPDHPRFKEVLTRAKQAEGKVEELETQLKTLSEQVNNRKDAGGSDELTQDEIDWLNRVDKGLEARGYVKKEDLNIEKRTQNLKGLTNEHNGSDGLPRFDELEVVAYAKANGFGENYRAAYNDMHHDAIVQVEAEKRAKNPTPIDSEKAGGGERKAPEADLTDGDIGSMSMDEYEKRREAIHASMKNSVKSK